MPPSYPTHTKFLTGPPSRARIERNRCHDNTEAGIALLSSEAEAIADNECWGKQLSGIVLARDTKSRDQPSRARIEGNRCHDNAESGIVLFSSEAETIADNECWGNQFSGIALQRDIKSLDHPSRARIERNLCHDNANTGIMLLSSEADGITDNECWGNKLSGIILGRDRESPDQPSRARIERNRCHDNAEYGIVLASSEAEVIADNECWGNQLSGILLQRDPQSRDQPSRARIEGNRCHDNTQSGIVLFSSSAEAIADNECWGNQLSGIAFERDTNSPDQPSRARLTGNSCNHNGRSGFALLGGCVLAFERNRVWDNVEPSLIPHPGSPNLLLPWTAPESALATSPDPEALSRRRARGRSGALAERLEQAGYAGADALARFASGMGCTACLMTAWKSGHDAGPPHRATTPAPKTADRPQEGRLYRLTPAQPIPGEPPPAVVFQPSGRACLTAVFGASRARPHRGVKAASESSAWWLARGGTPWMPWPMICN